MRRKRTYIRENMVESYQGKHTVCFFDDGAYLSFRGPLGAIECSRGRWHGVKERRRYGGDVLRSLWAEQ